MPMDCRHHADLQIFFSLFRMAYRSPDKDETADSEVYNPYFLLFFALLAVSYPSAL